MRNNLEQWTRTLRNYKALQLIPDPDPTDVGWVSNTTTGYGVGVIIGKRWRCFRLDKTPPQEKTGNIVAWLETIAIRLGLIMLLKLGVSPGKVYIVRTDNSTTFSVIL
jgi:hypothetical protein